jgi:cytochrome c2
MRTMRNKTATYLIAVMIIFILSGCGGEAQIFGVVRNAPELTAVAQGQQQAAPTSKDFVLSWQVFGTPTPRPTLSVNDSATATAYAQNRPTQGASVAQTSQSGSGLSAPLSPGDAGQGELVFMGAGTCMTCHDTTSGITIVGPSLKGVGSRAGQRIAGKSADEYLHESILNPTAYVVEGFNPLMPQNFGTALTPQQIADLIAYLKSLK